MIGHVTDAGLKLKDVLAKSGTETNLNLIISKTILLRIREVTANIN